MHDVDDDNYSMNNFHDTFSCNELSIVRRSLRKTLHRSTKLSLKSSTSNRACARVDVAPPAFTDYPTKLRSYAYTESNQQKSTIAEVKLIFVYSVAALK